MAEEREAAAAEDAPVAAQRWIHLTTGPTTGVTLPEHVQKVQDAVSRGGGWSAIWRDAESGVWQLLASSDYDTVELQLAAATMPKGTCVYWAGPRDKPITPAPEDLR